MRRFDRGERVVLLLLAALPAIALAPAGTEGRLLGPGDGTALHFPLRALAWEAWRRGELPSWNPGVHSGVPLLAGYRAGALYPPMLALALLPSAFMAFQTLVLLSLSAAAVLSFLYLRRLGADLGGAYVAGLSFSLGPYLLGHLDDTATLVAAPLLPLLLLAAESHMNRGTPARAAGLSLALALLLLAGSPEAARAGGALLAGRLLVGHALGGSPRRPGPSRTLLALLGGVLLAAPQWLPTLYALREAGPSATGLAGTAPALPGATGLVLRYLSHTPAGALALAALPLMLTQTPIRVLGVALALCLGLQWGQGPLAAPGALALVFDFTLAVLGGLSLSAQWRARHEPLGRRLRAYFLFAALASAAALSVAAATLGPLPETLAGAVGVLALALILYFSLATQADPLRAGLWLLPLTVSFLLQPHGRGLLSGAPSLDQLERGTVTRQALDRAMGQRSRQRSLTLAREWPRHELLDLGFGNLGALAGRRSANGYEPLAPQRSLELYDMEAGGTLPGAFFRTSPARLELLGVRYLQLPSADLGARPDRWGLGETLDVTLPVGQVRFFPLPISLATEIRIASSLADAVQVGQGDAVAEVAVRLASGRDLPLYVRAGEHTAEWAYDRPDVTRLVRHRRPRVIESFPGPEGGFEGHRYLGRLGLPGRYLIDGVRFTRLPGAGRFTLSRLGAHDAQTGRFAAASLVSGYVSDAGHVREVAATPGVRLYELPSAAGHAHVAARLWRLPDDAAVLRALRSPREAGLDPARDAIALESDVRGVALAPDAAASRAEIVRAAGSRLELRAAGPGLLVVAEGWDPGWRATLDDAPARVVRVNHAQLGLVLPAGTHRVTLRHEPRGFRAGLALAAAAAAGLGAGLFRSRGRG